MLNKYKKKLLVSIFQKSYERDIFKIDIKNNGPQKQLVYMLRFPVSYKNIQSINQKVNFTAYFDWMGQVREFSLRPVGKKIAKLAGTGKWGLATNSTKLKIYGLLKVDDVLEVRLWLDKISGHDNIYHLSFDWLKYLKENTYERVAFSSLVVTCVRIVGHGEAVLAKPPDFLKVFFESMGPRIEKKNPLKTYKTLFEIINFGKKIKDYPEEGLFIFENLFQTSLENSNLIGNIYFSNYSKWINSTLDLFLYQKNSSIFNKEKFKGEFITLECKVSHHKEAMPFDHILVKTYLSELYEGGMILKHEIFKKQSSGENVKLATANQKIAFIGYNFSLPTIQKIPSDILSIF